MPVSVRGGSQGITVYCEAESQHQLLSELVAWLSTPARLPLERFLLSKDCTQGEA